jgi:hypothetical protein
MTVNLKICQSWKWTKRTNGVCLTTNQLFFEMIEETTNKTDLAI